MAKETTPKKPFNSTVAIAETTKQLKASELERAMTVKPNETNGQWGTVPDFKSRNHSQCDGLKNN